MIAQLMLVALMGVASCSPVAEGGYGAPPIAVHGGGYGPPPVPIVPVSKGYGHSGPVKYEFSYGVNDPYHGTNFGHSEHRDGYNAKGQYYVHLPDGRLQKVTYYTDEWGYHPTVTYEGKAHFPSHGKGGYAAPPVAGYH